MTFRSRADGYVGRVRTELRDAFAESHTPGETAGSFALGAFVTMLPTLGTGLALFVAIAFVSDRISKLGLFASVVVFNPVVKWGVYAASFWLGTKLLGPAPGATPSNISFSAGPDIVVRLLVGNLIIAAVFTVVGYAVVLRLVKSFRSRDIELDEIVPRAD